VVRLQTNIYGGIQAVVVLPKGLLGASSEDRERGQQMHPRALSQTARPERVRVLAARPSTAIPGSPPQPTPDPAARSAEVPTLPVGRGNDPGRPAQPGVRQSLNGPVTDLPTVPAGAPATYHTTDHDPRPQLPRRRGQTHLAPQLREAPAVRSEELVGHDPGLMAAFMRGASLDEARPDEEDHFQGRADSVS
jgi:hypothetical protein